jgi:histidine triad (HIT) family protein
MPPCPFCRIASGAADAELVALRTAQVCVVPISHQRALNRGHMLVLPTEHVTRAIDLRPALLGELHAVAARVSMAVRSAFGASGATLFQNDEAPDQVLLHVHLHVVPRHAGDRFRIPDPTKSELSRAERQQQAAALRSALAQL